MAQHSKGPWKRSNRHNLFEVHLDGLKIVDAEGNPVATVVHGPANVKRSMNEWLANANLIVTACELLAASKHVVACLTQQKGKQAVEEALAKLNEVNEEAELDCNYHLWGVNG